MATQYEREFDKIIEQGGDIEKFKEDWHERACKAYSKYVRTEQDLNDFRCGKFKI